MKDKSANKKRKDSGSSKSKNTKSENKGDVGLSRVLADSYLLFTKLQNFHWNVVGPQFYSLHLLFELQYQEVYESLDVIAERLRGLEQRALGSFKEFQSHSKIKDSTERLSANEMIRKLIEDHETVVEGLYAAFERAEKADDQGTVDLCTERMRAHEKHLWMLRSQLARE